MKKYSIIILILCSWAMSLFAISCSDQESKPQPFLEIKKDTVVFAQEAANTSIVVNTNIVWQANVLSSGNWCTVQGSDDLLSIAVEKNTGRDLRETDIVVKGEGLEQKVHVKQLGEQPDILLENERLNLNYTDTVVTVKVVSNVEYEVEIPQSADWIKEMKQQVQVRAMAESERTFSIERNEDDTVRYFSVVFRSVDQKVERSLMFRQGHRDKEYKPGDPSELGDIFLPIASGKASEFNSDDESIEKSFDGTASTWYHSRWYGTVLPVKLEYTFETPQDVDYFVYKPRGSGNNGNWKKFDLYVSTAQKENYEKIASYDFTGSSSSSKISFAEPLKGVKSFRFEVNEAVGGVVSCGEMEFYRNAAPVAGLTEVFADELCSELRADVDQRKIDGLENNFFRMIAQSLYDKTYDLEYRVQTYEPYREINDLATEMKTSGYNPFENPTGIYFKDGEEAVVILGNTNGEQVNLKVYDFDAVRQGNSTPDPVSYPLNEGINKLRIVHGGLSYIEYYTPNWRTASALKLHIASGKVNGYYDKHRDALANWREILNKATYGCIDIKGDRINLVFGVNSVKTHCDDLGDLIQSYDNIVKLEHELMGLDQHNRRPKNHMFGRVTKDGLFADGWGAGWYEGCMNELANAAKSKGNWAIAHELGHVNQISPGLKWVSTTEVTNNVYSVCVRYQFGRDSMPLEQEKCNDGNNNNVLGGRFNSYLNYGIIKGEQWLCQKGQDNMDPSKYPYGGDHFVKLCPLWQLLLYYREIVGGEKRDWYGDVAEIVRNTDESQLTNGQLQLNFMRNTMDVVKEDLTDFFIKAGMLKPIDKELDDYARGQMTITQTDCDELVKYASKYPKPATPVLYYLSANSEKSFKDKLAVEGTYNEGVKVRNNGWIVINHDVWKNAVVFETYQGDELRYAAIVGTDSPDLSETKVCYPEGSTRIEAVSWDGKRKLVYGEK